MISTPIRLVNLNGFIDGAINERTCLQNIRYMNTLHPIQPLKLYFLIYMNGYRTTNHLSSFGIIISGKSPVIRIGIGSVACPL